MNSRFKWALAEGFLVIYFWTFENDTKIKGRLYHTPEAISDVHSYNFADGTSSVVAFGETLTMDADFYNEYGVQVEDAEEAEEFGRAWTNRAELENRGFKKEFAMVMDADY